MRKSLTPSFSDSLSTARVFGIPLKEVQLSGQPGQEVPLLVRHIVEYIEEHGGLDMEGLFLVNGNAERVDWLRQRYDSGDEVDLKKEADVASAVSLLRLFLQELPEPVIPDSLQTHILQLFQEYGSEEELARNMKYFLQQLPQVNYNLLRFLCRFLVGVASLQEETWSTTDLAAVFGPDVFHVDTDVEDLKEQESVSRILAELLDNQEELFYSEEDDTSTTNDYSSINEQITELLEDEKLEPCEELPPDCEATVPQPDISPSSSHIPPLSMPPGSAQIIERTILAAVEQHILDMKSSINSFAGQVSTSGVPEEEDVPGEMKPEDEEENEDEEEAQSELQEDQEVGTGEESSEEVQDSLSQSDIVEEPSGMELDTIAMVDAENNINTARLEKHQQGDQSSLFSSGFFDAEQDLNTWECSNQHLDLRQIFPDGDWEDPIPAFKSWQEESESGEAQLSPLAGRMVPLPLEEDAQPLLARRFLDFGHSQRFLQQDPDAVTFPTKSIPCGRHRRASFGSKECMKGDSTSHQLSRKLQSLKKKIKQYEEQFEKERNYKPSHGDKAANPKVLKWMTDLTKIRKQIKGRQHPSLRSSLRHQAVLQSLRRPSSSTATCSTSAQNTSPLTFARAPTTPKQAPLVYAKHKVECELAPQTRPRSNTLPKSFGSTLEQTGHDVGPVGEAWSHRPTREETLELIHRRIREKREEEGWPEDVRKLDKEQLSSEKLVLQKNLLHYESLHGRPVTREERLVVKPLYDRYRLVKQMLTRASITPIITSPSSKRRNQTLQPIIEGETAHFCDEIKEEEEEEPVVADELLSEASDIILALDSTARTHESISGNKLEERLVLDLRLSSTNASSMPELLEQLWKARAEKKKLRKTIREFEDEFYQRNGRNVQKEDRTPMMDKYKEYKRIKAKQRLLEVLISKQDSSKSI